MAEYKDRAIELGNDVAKLRQLRQSVEDARQSMKLFDTPLYVRHLEIALRDAWQQFSRGETPKSIDVTELVQQQQKQEL